MGVTIKHISIMLYVEQYIDAPTHIKADEDLETNPLGRIISHTQLPHRIIIYPDIQREPIDPVRLGYIHVPLPVGRRVGGHDADHEVGKDEAGGVGGGDVVGWGR